MLYCLSCLSPSDVHCALYTGMLNPRAQLSETASLHSPKGIVFFFQSSFDICLQCGVMCQDPEIIFLSFLAVLVK